MDNQSQPPLTPGNQPETTNEAPVVDTAAVTKDFSPAQQADIPITPQEVSITWSAKEYIHPDKSPVWYVFFVIIALALIAVDVFLLKSWSFSILVVVMSIALIVYIRRPARTLTYALSNTQGLYIGETLYKIEDFKSFGIISDEGGSSIMLIPVKRFASGVSVYFPDEAGEQIVDILGSVLPMEDLKLDVIDIIVRKLRL